MRRRDRWDVYDDVIAGLCIAGCLVVVMVIVAATLDLVGR